MTSLYRVTFAERDEDFIRIARRLKDSSAYCSRERTKRGATVGRSMGKNERVDKVEQQ